MPISGNAQPFNRQQPKQQKMKKEWHTASTKYGMGDHYGQGVKAKVGTIREDFMGMTAVPSKKLKTPPRSLA